MDWIRSTLEELENPTYDDRKVAKEENSAGYTISTCWVNDENCFETAVFANDEGRNVHPVERCMTLEEAKEQHAKWMSLTKKGLKIYPLGPGREVKEQVTL
jgi:hypothetical protein